MSCVLTNKYEFSRLMLGKIFTCRKKRHLQKHDCFEGLITCLAVEGCAGMGETQGHSDDMYTNVGDAADMNGAVREVQAVLTEFREEVLPLSLKAQGGLLRGGGLMEMRVVCSR